MLVVFVVALAVGLVLLALAFLAQLADAWFGFDAPAWEVARNLVLAGFLVCFVGYVVITAEST